MSNLAADTAATFCATLVDEWFRCGVREAVVCPGSRSTPLAVALAHHGGIRLRVRLDERGAGFFGIGLAMAGPGRRPVVVLTTSGTAAAELHAAVVEAHHARVPLIVCTADRPPELQAVGAPQTIDQSRLFGGAVRWFVDPGVADEGARGAWRSVAARAVAEAVSGPLGPGPVHLNLPFREPLLGVAGDLPAAAAGGSAWHEVSGGRVAGPSLRAFFRQDVRPGARGVIVAGGDHHDQGVAVDLLAERLGWPVLADPRSGCRLAHRWVIGAADSLLRDEGFVKEHQPEVVLRVGAPWASKVLAGWLTRTAAAGVPHLAVDPDWQWQDAGREVSRFWNGTLDPALLEDCMPAGVGPGTAAGDEWLQGWAAAESIAQAAIDETLAAMGVATEPGVARSLYAWTPAAATMVVSSSMPVRDLEWFGRPRTSPPRVLANRGANGIDGVVSTALGVAAGLAATSAGGPLYGLVGDLAVLHDASALVRPVRAAAMPAVIVVVDNGGGGIFDFLPQASALDAAEFEQLFGTPQLPAVAGLVRGCGYSVTEIGDADELLPAFDDADAETIGTGEPVFVVVRTDRKRNVAVHQEIEAAVGAAMAGARGSE
ncbi:MAG TPA: 2-succinyl-5-enolpyruvyl-6-hydroxy-3-cyclohexene-1-carboxylic-acid synthase [Acidimicrobiales bacterium]|nr:2-succinyl-5-enolpyruvyl-6-hydroxy-3-cyclohexene-1-carboxylic-acid synthase [Acidimicrobiales bacterium]